MELSQPGFGAQASFDILCESGLIGIAISRPDGRIARTNSTLDELLGYAEGELAGRELSEFFLPADLPAVQHGYQRLLSGDKPQFRTQVRLSCKDGETVWTRLIVSVLPGAEPARHLITLVQDTTELHLLRERLTYQTLHDLQTGLPNRHYLLSHLEEVLGRCAPAAVVTLLHLDLDGFSVINDGVGHSFGDRLLNTVARRLESVVSDHQAMVARLGGDEYAILIEPGDTVPAVDALADVINAELTEALYLGGLGVAVTATMGIVQQPAAGADPADLLRAASAALRRSRGRGTGQRAVFDADIDALERAELRLAAGMGGALETGELQVHYQPVVALEGGGLVGVEAVLTRHHPQLGVLPHDRCMQLAERTGAVHAVGRWMLATAAEQARLWRDQLGAEPPPIMINLAVAQAQDPTLGAQLQALLRQTGLRPSALEVRLPMAATHPVPALIDLGLRTSLHDFTGNLGELTHLAPPWVNAVRIAPALARQVADNPSALPARALGAVVPALHTAGIRVVACAVDTARSAQWWRAVGADAAAGALFGTPRTPQHIAPLLGPQP